MNDIIAERSSTVPPPPTLRESPGLVFGESTIRYTTSSEHPGGGNDSNNKIPKRQCHPFHIEYCKQLPYNFTTFPNAMGHHNHIEAKNDIERFK